jgi:hypothetical protein
MTNMLKRFWPVIILALLITGNANAYNIVKNNAIYVPNPAKLGVISLGSMYVGNPDTDPTVVENQKTIYVKDESGTVTAVSQPLTIGAGGLPLYNGDPVTVLTDGDYSLMILNSLGSQIYYIPSDLDSTLDTAYVADIATLRLSTGVTGQSVQPQGYYAYGDGAGGPLRTWASGAAPGTYVDNGGSIIVPTGGDGSAAWLGSSVYVWSAEDFGAKGDGATDDAARIQAAIDYAETSTGSRTIRFSNKNYAIATGVVIDGNNVILDCAGMQYTSGANPGGIGVDDSGYYTQFGGTVWTWIGTTGTGTMLQIAAPVAGPLITGCGITGGLVLDGDTKALKGFEMLSHQGGKFDTILAADCQTRQVELNVRDNTGWAVSNANTQHNHFGRITVSCWRAESAEGMLMDGDDAADTSINFFGEIDYIHKDGIGLRLGSTGANQMQMVFGYRKPGGTGVGIRLDSGNSVADDPVTNHFGFVQTYAGGMVVQGFAEGSLPPKWNSVDAYSGGNGGPFTPTINYGGQLSYDTEWGGQFNQRITSFPYYELNRVTTTANDPVGSIQFTAYDSSETKQTYAQIDTTISVNTDGAEYGLMRFMPTVNGSASVEMSIKNGVAIGSPTGAYKGTGTLNATAVYDDNVLLTCYVIEHYLTGTINTTFWDTVVHDRDIPEVVNPETGEVVSPARREIRNHDAARAFALTAAWQLDTPQWVQWIKDNGRLPAFPGPEQWEDLYDGNLPTGTLIQKLWETVEVQAVHISKLHERVKALEEAH